MPNNALAETAAEYLNEMMAQKDSCGGIIECRVTGLPVGLGEPVFDKLDAQLSKGIMSMGAVKAVEIGDGFLASLPMEAPTTMHLPLHPDISPKRPTIPEAFLAESAMVPN